MTIRGRCGYRCGGTRAQHLPDGTPITKKGAVLDSVTILSKDIVDEIGKQP